MTSKLKAPKKVIEKPEPPSYAVAALQRKRKMLDKKIADLRDTIKSIDMLTNELNKRLDERGEIDDALELVLAAEARAK